jgi:hypothetical protein
MEQLSNFNCLGNLLSNGGKDTNTKLQRCNKINGIIKLDFGKNMAADTK